MDTYPRYPLIEIWGDHFHYGSTDVHLYEVVDDIVVPKNYPARMSDLEKKVGWIGDAEYMWYSCAISDNPDPRKRLGLRFGLQRVWGGGFTYVIYDNFVCKDVISYIRRTLNVGRRDIKPVCGKQIILFFDKRRRMGYRLVGVKYL